ncbi:MAG: hypothetical protein QOH30_2570 [Baekduia sp.]|jgi:hypothetical protein|nr:hypothetical protein [Conexibacter sp.]MDX6716012.1 hypothetical protein [Baekduia sp.]MDX6730828.1 hypothetical protein [Baekduia sp.]
MTTWVRHVLLVLWGLEPAGAGAPKVLLER